VLGARPRTLLLAVAAGLALADTSIVTLALPELLQELDTTVEGVAAVLGVYTVVLAAALPVAERLQRTHGVAAVGAAGATLFGVAGIVCGVVDSLVPLLVARGAQAVGGAAVLVAAFVALTGGDERRGRALWLGAAVLAAAVGPALGGLLTELFSWRAIFLVQAPVGLVAAAAWAGQGEIGRHIGGGSHPGGPSGFTLGPAAALALVSAALSAVLFLLVLLLVAGWAVAPLEAAAAVTVIPIAALVGARIGGDARARAAAGCALVGGGVLALAYLPDARLLWTVPPQVAAGLGMGLALKALGGELLPEHDARDAARLLSIRHAGIAFTLIALAPVVSADLEDATRRAQERGAALVLDARLAPLDKLRLAPELLSGVDEESPRGALRDALDEQRADFEGEERVAFDDVADRADETLVTAVGEAFRTAFLVTGALSLLAALLLVPRTGGLAIAAAIAIAAALPAGWALAHDRLAPEPVALLDPCEERPLPESGGITGFLQDRALQNLDATACRNGSSREELVLAIADEDEARRYEEKYGRNPRNLGDIIGTILGG
jgi:MFS family permease